MDTQLTAVLSTVLSGYIFDVGNSSTSLFEAYVGVKPNTTLQYMLLGLMGSLFVACLTLLRGIALSITRSGKLFRTYPHLILTATASEAGVKDSTYYRMQQWILREGRMQLLQGIVCEREGDISFEPTQLQKVVTTTHAGHAIQLSLGAPRTDAAPPASSGWASVWSSANREKSEDSAVGFAAPPIYVTSKSKTATLHDLRDFVDKVVRTEKPISNMLTVHTAVISQARKNGKRANATAAEHATHEWVTHHCKTNKRLGNTVLSRQIEESLVADLAWFMSNEAWYSTHGLPYKRGYILHGPPGTGKTSVIRAAATEHNVPICIINAADLSSDSQLCQLVLDLRQTIQGAHYFLVFEDIDRSPLFAGDMRRRAGEKGEMTIGAFLQVLDGVSENYGQIVFMTANDPSGIDQYGPALRRPGRIDVTAEIGFCDGEQLIRLLQSFYGVDVVDVEDPVWCAAVIKSNLSPATVVQHMQKYRDDWRKVAELCTSGSTRTRTRHDGIPIDGAFGLDDPDGLDLEDMDGKPVSMAFGMTENARIALERRAQMIRRSARALARQQVLLRRWKVPLTESGRTVLQTKADKLAEKIEKARALLAKRRESLKEAHRLLRKRQAKNTAKMRNKKQPVPQKQQPRQPKFAFATTSAGFDSERATFLMERYDDDDPSSDHSSRSE